MYMATIRLAILLVLASFAIVSGFANMQLTVFGAPNGTQMTNQTGNQTGTQSSTGSPPSSSSAPGQPGY